MDDRLAFFKAKFHQHAVHTFGAKNAHQIILQRQVKLRSAGIALATGTTAQLVINPAAFVALCPNDVKPISGKHLGFVGFDFGSDFFAFFFAFGVVCDVRSFFEGAHFKVAAELNIGAAARHIGGDGDRARATRLGNDAGFLCVITGVEDVMFNFALFNQDRKSVV